MTSFKILFDPDIMHFLTMNIRNKFRKHSVDDETFHYLPWIRRKIAFSDWNRFFHFYNWIWRVSATFFCFALFWIWNRYQSTFVISVKIIKNRQNWTFLRDSTFLQFCIRSSKLQNWTNWKVILFLSLVLSTEYWEFWIFRSKFHFTSQVFLKNPLKLKMSVTFRGD